MGMLPYWTEEDNIVNDYKCIINELNDLYEKTRSMKLVPKNIKILIRLIEELREEYTVDLIEQQDYPSMLHTTEIIKNLFRIYQKEINIIKASTVAELVNIMYQVEKETGEGSNISDNYHTMSELYFNRMVMFDIILKMFPDKAWKSKLHDDGTMFDNYFIVGIDTPEGQFTYHYHMRFWNIFTCKEIPRAPKWDNHQPKDIARLYSLL